MQKECECIMFGKLKNLFSQPGMIRWIAPVLLVAILASELASKIFGVFSI